MPIIKAKDKDGKIVKEEIVYDYNRQGDLIIGLEHSTGKNNDRVRKHYFNTANKYFIEVLD